MPIFKFRAHFFIGGDFLIEDSHARVFTRGGSIPRWDFRYLADHLRMDVLDLMRHCNGKVPPTKALVKGLARELDINESYLEMLAEEVRKDLQ
jgi:hypothetical protein